VYTNVLFHASFFLKRFKYNNIRLWNSKKSCLRMIPEILTLRLSRHLKIMTWNDSLKASSRPHKTRLILPSNVDSYDPICSITARSESIKSEAASSTGKYRPPDIQCQAGNVEGKPHHHHQRITFTFLFQHVTLLTYNLTSLSPSSLLNLPLGQFHSSWIVVSAMHRLQPLWRQVVAWTC
jgi:hypothetical protein